VASRRTPGLKFIAVIGAVVPLLIVPGLSAGAAAAVTEEHVVAVAASGTISVQRGRAAQPDKLCPAGDKPADAAKPHRPPEVPAGMVAVGTAEAKAPGLCRYEQAAVLAFAPLTLPDDVVVSSARLELQVASVGSATELQLTSTSAAVPTKVPALVDGAPRRRVRPDRRPGHDGRPCPARRHGGGRDAARG
jgi:hypothetical protein